MSEENKSAELNDAELKEVGGGSGLTTAAASAERMCVQCKSEHSDKADCDKWGELTGYLKNNTIMNYSLCPFFR